MERICILHRMEPGASLPLPSGWRMRSQVGFLSPPGQRQQKCPAGLPGVFHHMQLSKMHPLSPSAWIRFTRVEMCDPYTPCSFPLCWCRSALPLPGDLQMEEHGEGVFGAPLPQAPLSHPHKVGAHASFILSFFYLGSNT